MMVANVLNDPRWTWPYMTEAQTHLNGKPQKWVHGRVIGGSSSVNGNLFVRDDPEEYDAWRDEKGCAGWGYADLLPIFMRLEDFPEGDPAADPQLRVRGTGGLRVVDSSICPTIPASNTNIPSIAIGEKGADLLLEAARA